MGEAFKLLPSELKKSVEQNENGSYNFANALVEWPKIGKDKVEEVDKSLKKEQEEKNDDANWKFNPEKFNLDKAKFYDNGDRAVVPAFTLLFSGDLHGVREPGDGY